MDKAKAAVASFTGKRGHSTDVTESVAPGVVNEHIKPTRHEEVQEAVDREVHQDHYHTTIQPIQHQEILPEQHQHQMKPIVEKEFHHGNEHETRQRLEAEAAQFKNTTHTHETRHTTAAAPRVEGEHVHHHVHETVQPIVHKETITPEVVHTTVPIHEQHHAASQHHGISTLPMKTLDAFKSGGGILKGGNTASHETYEGAPRPYNRELMSDPTESDLQPGQTGLGSGAHHTGGTGLADSTSGTGMRPESGYAGSNVGAGSTNNESYNSGFANKAESRVDGDMNGRSGLDTGSGIGGGGMSGSGTTGGTGGQFGTVGNTTRDNDFNTSNSNTSTEGKPSIMDKIKRAL